jgi:N-acetylneuraminate synthase
MVGDGHPPLVIAEAGINHCGNMRLARDMVKAAAEAGAECIKFQCHIPSEEMTDAVPAQVLDTVRGCSLDADQERDLCTLARDLGMIYISTPFSIAAADRLRALDLPAYKIGSGELTNMPLIEHVASFGKPMIVSTGMATFETVSDVDDVLEDAGCYQIAYLNCTSVYPTPPEAMRFDRMLALRGLARIVGSSDHSKGVALGLAAATLGASIIEKHFTLSHDLETPDGAVSIDPAELALLVTGVRDIHEATRGVRASPRDYVEGDGYVVEELAVAVWAHHSVTLRKPVSEGETLTAEHLTCKRPAGGLPPSKLRECVGRKAARDMAADTQVREGDLA